ncbi:hypothetical protein DYJ42_04845 [Streptococcus constellatus]|uniref:DUF5592 family protein n=1 Tax=Streptococcus constellatus TaxID=76860 RepID=UPI000E5B8152|nr:DUF5592 family protein [Streptococcus constellatus]RID95979.1 hypothetical protein DYJ42_04845 [Streptococcus constellatus]
MNEKYGVPRDIKARMKMVGLFMADISFVGLSGIIALRYATKIFPTEQWFQMILFIVLSMLLALYLVFPANGGKKNWNTLYLFFRRRRRRYISLDYQKRTGER